MSQDCILIIEDQEDLAELLEVTLKTASYRTRIALTGEEGLAEFRTNGADVVLLDMTLPEMNGLQVLRKIRNINANVPVIIVTAETNEQLRKDCERLGVHDYLSKPVKTDVLLTAISLALEARSEDAELVTLLLPKQIIQRLSEINTNLAAAITQLVETQGEPHKQARAATARDED